MFRCPVCIGVLAEPAARRCPFCRQSLRRRRPRVLGEDTRPGTRMLPIERAIAARAQSRLEPARPGAPAPDGTSTARAGESPDPAIAAERAPLDQEVRALVDGLYERARAETGAGRDERGGSATAQAAAPVAPRRGWVAAVLAEPPRAHGRGSPAR